MSVLPFKTVRQRVATALTGLAGYRQSPWMLDTFGSDPDTVQHHTFAVGLTGSQPHPQPGRRQAAEGLATASILTTAVRTDLHLVWDGSSRSALGEGWIIITLNFTAVHRI